MTVLEITAGFFFVAMLNRIAPVDSAAFWLVAVPAMICMGLAGWGGYRQGRLSRRSEVPRYRYKEKSQ